LTVMFAAPFILAADQPAKKPNFSTSELKFETNSVLFSEFSASKVPGMQYVARFGLDTDIKFRVRQNWGISNGRKHKSWGFIDGYERKILKTPTGKKLSQAQKVFILKGYALINFNDGSEFRNIIVNGVDKEQAQKTAIAFLEYLSQDAEKKYRFYQEDVLRRETEYQKLVKEFEPHEKKLKISEGNYEKQKSSTHYLTQEAALKAIERMNVIFEENVIKLCVLKAKHKVVAESLAKENAIKSKSSSEKYARQSIIVKLEELLIDISIALAEVEATVKSVEKIRSEAERFIRYQDEYSLVYTNYADLKDKVDKAKKELIRAGNRFASPSKEMLPPKVIDNKITLQPVKNINSRGH
jgi:hypothetical protein